MNTSMLKCYKAGRAFSEAFGHHSMIRLPVLDSSLDIPIALIHLSNYVLQNGNIICSDRILISHRSPSSP